MTTLALIVGSIGAAAGGSRAADEPGPGIAPPAVPPARVETWREPAVGMEFVEVPGGEFEMGANDGDSEQRPAHRVRVDGFWLGRSEVTQGQWLALMGSNPSKFRSCGDDCPVENVSWNDAQEFIRRLSARSGEGFRLPTEAEWEYAARGGSPGQRWAGTDRETELPDHAWYGDVEGRTQRVCTKRPNRFWLCDMSGNVWEWVQDWRGGYSSAFAVNPAGPATGTQRVIRGGGWLSGPRMQQAAYRSRSATTHRNGSLGFRLVATSGPR